MRYTAQKQSVNYYHDQNYRAVIAVWFVTSERFAHSKIHHLIIMRYNRCHSNDNPGSPNRILDFASIAPIRIDPCHNRLVNFRDMSYIECTIRRLSSVTLVAFSTARTLLEIYMLEVLIFSIYNISITNNKLLTLIKFLFFSLF